MMEELKPQAQALVLSGVKKQIIFYNLICIGGLKLYDFYIKIHTTKDPSSGTNFASPFRVLHLHRSEKVMESVISVKNREDCQIAT